LAPSPPSSLQTAFFRPTPRKKEEVPVWIYLASELSLKLHGAQSDHAFPRILRAGGPIEALGPELGGRRSPHPDTGDVTLACPGFNDKNDYDRQPPATRTSSASLPARQLSGPSIAMNLARPRIRTHLTAARAFLPFSVSTTPPPPSLPRKAPPTV